LLKVISALALLAQTLFPTAPPGVGRTDAYARAAGNEKAVAVTIGRALFTTEWPAQVLNVYADGIAGHNVAGLRVSGVRFHHALTREEYISEIAALVQKTFEASSVEEVEVWATVPLRVGKDIIVAGDLARPTSRTVFTLSVRRGESSTSFIRRMRQGQGVFWDQEWTHTGLK
jgi:hypothetical protein